MTGQKAVGQPTKKAAEKPASQAADKGTPATSDKPIELTVLLITPAHNNVLDAVQMFKNKRKENVIIADDLADAEQKIAGGLTCVVLVSLANDKTLAGSIEFFKVVSPVAKSGMVRIIAVSKVFNEQLKQGFMARGANEFLSDKTSASALYFKITVLLSQLKMSLDKMFGSNANKKQSFRSDGRRGGNDAITIKGGGAGGTIVDAIADDIWLVKGVPPRKIGVQWVVEAEGPDPDSGDWEFMGFGANKKERWAWRPLGEDGSKLPPSDEGWTFTGNKPLFDNERKKWRMVGAAPDLSHEKDGKKTGSKISTDPDKGIMIAKDTAAAEERIAKTRKIGEIVKKARDEATAAKIAAIRAAEAEAAERQLREQTEMAEQSRAKRKRLNADGEEVEYDPGADEEAEQEENALKLSKLKEAEDEESGVRGKRKDEDDDDALMQSGVKSDEAPGAHLKGRKKSDEEENGLRSKSTQEDDDAISLRKGKPGEEDEESQRRRKKSKDEDDLSLTQKGKSVEEDGINLAKGGKASEEDESVRRGKKGDEDLDEISLSQKTESEKQVAEARKAAEEKRVKKEAAVKKEAEEKENEVKEREKKAAIEREKKEGLLKAGAAKPDSGEDSPDEVKASDLDPLALAEEIDANGQLVAKDGEKDGSSSGGRRKDGKDDDAITTSDFEEAERVKPQFKTFGEGLGGDSADQKNYMFKRTNGILRALQKPIDLERVGIDQFGKEEGIWEEVGETGWLFVTPGMRCEGLSKLRKRNEFFFVDRKSPEGKPYFDGGSMTWLFQDGHTPQRSPTFDGLQIPYRNFLSKMGLNPETPAEAKDKHDAEKMEEGGRTLESFSSFTDVVKERKEKKDAEKKAKASSHLGFFLKLSDMAGGGKTEQEMGTWVVNYVKDTFKVKEVDLLRWPLSDPNARVVASLTKTPGEIFLLIAPEYRTVGVMREKKIFQVSDQEIVFVNPVYRKIPSVERLGLLVIRGSIDQLDDFFAAAHYFDQLIKQLTRLLQLKRGEEDELTSQSG